MLPRDLLEYKASGLAMKSDFDYMLKTILQTIGDHAEQNGGKVDWGYARNFILDAVNEHRRRMAKNYAVKLRDFVELEQAIRRYYGDNNGKEQ